MEMSPDTAQNQQRTVSTVLFLSGLAFIGAGLAIGFFVSPIGFVGLVIRAWGTWCWPVTSRPRSHRHDPPSQRDDPCRPRPARRRRRGRRDGQPLRPRGLSGGLSLGPPLRPADGGSVPPRRHRLRPARPRASSSASRWHPSGSRCGLSPSRRSSSRGTTLPGPPATSDDAGAEPRTSGRASEPDAVHDPLQNPHGHQDP